MNPLNRAWRLFVSIAFVGCLYSVFTASSSAWAQTGPGLLDRLTSGVGSQAAAPQSLPGPGPLSAGQVKVSLFSEASALIPGQTVRLGLRIEHAPGWHTYWRNPGDSGLPTELVWQLARPSSSSLSGSGGSEPLIRLSASEVQWPTPSRFPVGPLASYGYEGDLFLVQAVEVPSTISTGETANLLLSAAWLVCKDVCIPGNADLSLSLPVLTAGSTAPASADQFRFAQADAQRPVPAAVSPAYAIDLQAQQLVLFGNDPPQAVEGGYFFLAQEGLVWPAAAQALFATDRGWRLEIPFAPSSQRLLRELEQTPRDLTGVFKPAGHPESPAVEWRLAPVTAAAQVPARAQMVSSGLTAEQAYAASASGSAGGVWGPGPQGFVWALFLALVGGMLLNLMPCVFPVLGLKVLAFSQQAHSPGEAWRHGLIFTAGVVVSMLVLAALFLGLRAAGEAIGWGFQLQNPWVVSLLALLFVAIALNLFGVFEMGLGLARLGGTLEASMSAPGLSSPKASQAGSGQGAFGSGVLAVVVASPCTAPFMGSALGYTATAPTAAALAVFAMLGLGLALPYLILAVWPAALSLLPRPGPWMQTFRQVLGFPMLATSAWLAWVLTEQNGPSAILSLLLAFVCLALALWAYGRWQDLRLQSRATSAVYRFAGVMGIFSLGTMALVWQAAQSSGPVSPAGPASPAVVSPGMQPEVALDGQAWQPGLPEQLASQGQVVFVDFTAAWCISCQANKARVIQRGEVAQRLSSPGYRLLVADWTRQDPRITQELNRHGRNGVPLYLVYGPGLRSPEILGEWLTEQEVLRAFERAAGRS